ncbi:Stage II sporulation protein E (SpoIIE) [Actinacidiphila alni]|uniref:Stage II sporulation protein E (SpoIIE) n=1 Tax=Actinacidiphila alni TaxID=380248 RepID=A0A1I1Z872_9ACTN|nr:PP2C family protein-serine/threonine phosphatase [Actinacidiphila alni]SFE27752.1 Stage II sporulation protein E (SpoIIE) [Actinacidiphila alni]
MSAAHVRKVAGTEPSPSAAAQNAAPSGGPTQVTTAPAVPAGTTVTPPAPAPTAPRHVALTADRYGSPAVQDRLASWVCDLSLVHELTERLSRTGTLDDALHEVLRAGATLVGARRGMIALEPADGLGPDRTIGLGLGHADLGTISTVPPEPEPEPEHVRAPEPRTSANDNSADGADGDDGEAGTADEAATDSDTTDATEATDATYADDGTEHVHPDLLHEPGLGNRHREVAVQLGLGASYALRLTAETHGRLGTAVWFYDEPAEPDDRQRRLMGLYLRYAAEHTARVLDLRRARDTMAAFAAELLPERLPRVPGVRMAVRHSAGPRGGGDWYDALPLPEGALGLAVGGVTGRGPGAVAAMGRLRASLRAYAVMEGEDPVAVLSDLELLMRLTEPARSATALFAYVEPPAAPGRTGTSAVAGRKLTLAGAGHCPPLVVGDRRCEYVETTLSAPLNMLSCWEAPSVELYARPGETLLLYSDGLLHRTGESADRALARLHAAAQGAPRAVRDDPDRLADHIVRTVLPEGLEHGLEHGPEDPGGTASNKSTESTESTEDVVLLAVRFD